MPLYEVGYIWDNNGAKIGITVQNIGKQVRYIETKMRNNTAIKDDNGIVIYGMKDVPGYVITKAATVMAWLSGNTQLYRISAFTFLF